MGSRLENFPGCARCSDGGGSDAYHHHPHRTALRDASHQPSSRPLRSPRRSNRIPRQTFCRRKLANAKRPKEKISRFQPPSSNRRSIPALILLCEPPRSLRLSVIFFFSLPPPSFTGGIPVIVSLPTISHRCIAPQAPHYTRV